METQNLTSRPSAVVYLRDLSDYLVKHTYQYEGDLYMANEEKEAVHIEHEEAELQIQYKELRLKSQYEQLELEKKELEILKKKLKLKSGQWRVRTPLSLDKKHKEPPRSGPELSEIIASSPSSFASSGPTEPSEFKAAVLAAVNEPQALASLLIFNKMPDTKIFVARQGQTRFTLRPCRDVFAFSEQKEGDTDEDLMDPRDDSDVYWHLQRSEREYLVAYDSEQNRKPRWTADVTKSDRFIAIGWLVESNETGFHRTTNYVCCLDLSTKPISLWLIYDYRQPDPEQGGVLRTADVPDRQSSYNDPAWDHEESHTSCEKTGEEASMPERCSRPSLLNPRRAGYMEQDAPWDVACLYNDVGDWPNDEKLATGDARLTTVDLAGNTLRVKHRKLNGLEAL